MNAAPTYIDHIADLGACSDALDWLRTEDHQTLEAAYAACPRGDWLLWLHGRLTASSPWSDERKPLARAAMECARLALPIYETRTGRTDVRSASDVILAWTRGEVGTDEAKAARVALRSAYAAYAADAADAASTKTLARCAEIVRKHYPTAPELGREGGGTNGKAGMGIRLD